ncbi:hypothetical protein LEN26_012192 [Aphanomyces euteiches]|nr:hypothetical protein LEN26_012192 [Aphanomyces euteiches]
MLSPRTPNRRGPYKRIPLSAKRRVVAAFEEGDDWVVVVAANGINSSSARNWFSRASIEPLPRGGKPRILTDELVDKMQEWIEFDNQITLEEIKAKLVIEEETVVSTSTIHRELDKRIFTYKMVHYEPLQMNDMTFKEKRRDYVQQYRALSGQEKIPTWLDETNFNLFTARSKARSLRGTRAVSYVVHLKWGKVFTSLELSLQPILRTALTNAVHLPTCMRRNGCEACVNMELLPCTLGVDSSLTACFWQLVVLWPHRHEPAMCRGGDATRSALKWTSLCPPKYRSRDIPPEHLTDHSMIAVAALVLEELVAMSIVHLLICLRCLNLTAHGLWPRQDEPAEPLNRACCT